MDEQLKEDIWSIWKILLDCQENLAFSRYLYKPETDDEREYMSFSKELQYIRFSLWKLGIIEIHKILSGSKNDVYSLWNLMKSLENGKYSAHGISKNVILSWKSSLKSAEITLSKISLLRNKRYAHTDRKVEIKEKDITFEEVEAILKFIESVIKDVYSHAFKSGIVNETLVFQKDKFDVIKILAKERKDRMQGIIDLAKSYGGVE